LSRARRRDSHTSRRARETLAARLASAATSPRASPSRVVVVVVARSNPRRAAESATDATFGGGPTDAMDAQRASHGVGHVLCCMCGVGIPPNPAGMCVDCIRSQVRAREPQRASVGRPARVAAVAVVAVVAVVARE
jgi:hypothetical protein